MERFIKGDIIVVPFPFSDLSSSKKRPALVLANIEGDDLILAQITSKNILDSYSIKLESDDFSSGTLNMKSNVRPNKLFTADKSVILYKVGSLNKDKMNEVTDKLVDIFTK